MLLELRRVDCTEARTIGTLTIATLPNFTTLSPAPRDAFSCFTLEDPLERPAASAAGPIAIPFGQYRVRLTFSERFQRVLPLLDGVLGHTGIRIHAGNTAADTRGCILVGRRRKADSIHESRAALEALLPHLQAAAGVEEVWIEVLDGRPSPPPGPESA